MFSRKKTEFQHVLVTGASSGIGLAVARRFAQLGVRRISICGRDENRLEAAAASIRERGASDGNAGPHVRADVLDVSDADATRRWIEACDAEAPIELCFANAGISTGGREDEEGPFRAVFAVNVNGGLNTLLPAISAFRRRDRERAARHLAITSSMAGFRGLPQCPAYSASKACVRALGAALRGRLAPEGIRVSTICPGFVRSRITDENDCPMPFFMEADDAARIICDGIARGKAQIAFPLPMALACRLLECLPEPIAARVLRFVPEKSGRRMGGGKG